MDLRLPTRLADAAAAAGIPRRSLGDPACDHSRDHEDPTAGSAEESSEWGCPLDLLAAGIAPEAAEGSVPRARGAAGTGPSSREAPGVSRSGPAASAPRRSSQRRRRERRSAAAARPRRSWGRPSCPPSPPSPSRGRGWPEPRLTLRACACFGTKTLGITR